MENDVRGTTGAGVQGEMRGGEARSEVKEAVAKGDAGAALRAIRRMLADGAKPHEVAFCAGSVARLATQMKEQAGAKVLRTFLVRSVTVEPVVPYLIVEAALSNFVLDLQIGGFGSYADELLNPKSQLASFAPELVLVLLDLEDIAGELPDLCATGTGAGVPQEIEAAVERFGTLLRSLRSRSGAKLVVQGMFVPDLSSLGDVADGNFTYSLPNAVVALNRRLAELCGGLSNCLFFDVDRVAARFGRANWRDERLFLSSRLPVAAAAFGCYTRGLVRCISAMFRSPRKVLCTDLDNTLWGGILGEDGVDGIVTGSAFPGVSYLNYQRYLKQLSARGILLAVVSKNNEGDVREAFQMRAADLALKLDDFVALKINWNDKAQSIRELAEELSLGLDSFVFVDDNPVECEAIRQQVPGVAILAAPVQEPWRLVGLLASQPFFDTVAITDDDANRLKEYKAQAQRAELEGATGSRDDFLASLGIVCTFLSALQAPLTRSVQLLGKTNQFNLTTRRHSEVEVERFAGEPGGQALVVRARDRFGDAGVVGLALAKMVGEDCYIDSFLLSCRVIGRGIETALLARIAQTAVGAGAKRLMGEFVPTKKNALCADFYLQHGFEKIAGKQQGSGDSIFYEIDLTAAIPKTPTWINIEETNHHELRTNTAISS